MSETRPYPKILRTTEAADALLRAYAREYEIAPFEALVVAIDRLADPVESDTLRASLDAAGKLAERLAADLAAERKAAAALSDDLASASEATRRADAEAEATRRANKILADRGAAAEADVARLTRELADLTKRIRTAAQTLVAAIGAAGPENLERTAERAAARIEELTDERDAATNEARKVEALHLEAVAELDANARSLRTERDAARAELAVARTLRAEAEERERHLESDAASQPCACALPADLEERVRARIAARPNAKPPRDLAFIVKNGCDRLEASDRYQDAQKAARAAAKEA